MQTAVSILSANHYLLIIMKDSLKQRTKEKLNLFYVRCMLITPTVFQTFKLKMTYMHKCMLKNTYGNSYYISRQQENLLNFYGMLHNLCFIFHKVTKTSNDQSKQLYFIR